MSDDTLVSELQDALEALNRMIARAARSEIEVELESVDLRRFGVPVEHQYKLVARKRLA